MKLNVLCQSPVSEGMRPTEAVANTIRLAEAAERLGYHRFWVAEHHADSALACASPEILIAHIAAKTEHIQVGSGGVLLPYYAPFKVAEQFRLLSTLHPGRIDLGLGRAGGSEGQAPAALGGMRPNAWASIDELLGWLGGKPPLPDTFAGPSDAEAPTPWVLGTSPSSATFAGERGLAYAFGGFLDPRSMMAALEAYHRTFQPSRWLERPKVNVAWYVQAAETEADAHAMTRSSEHWFIETFARGNTKPFPNPAHIQPSYAPMEQMMLQMRRQFALVGTGEQVVDGLQRLRKQTMADELTLVTIPFDPADRLASYSLIAAAAGLGPRTAVS